MSTKKSWLGGHEVSFDPNDLYDDAVAMQGVRTETQIYLGLAASLANHAVRKSEYDTDKLARLLEVADIDDPATELLSRSGVGDGDLLLAYEGAAFTLYAWSTETLTASSPYIVTGDGGFWVAAAGSYTRSIEAGKLILHETGNLVITAATVAIPSSSPYLRFYCNDSYTSSANPQIVAGTRKGQILILENYGGDNTFTLTAGADLVIDNAANTLAISPLACVSFIWNGTAWVQWTPLQVNGV